MIIEPTEDSRQLAKFINDSFDGNSTEVLHYYDQTNEYHIPILKVSDSPYKGIKSISTLGLYNFPIFYKNVEQNYRYEISIAGNNTFLENIISTIAFFVIKDKIEIKPGTIIHDIMKMFDEKSPIKAFLFCPPYSWNINFLKSTVDGFNVDFLQLIPLTQYDLEQIEKIGWSELLECDFKNRKLNIFDFDRAE